MNCCATQKNAFAAAGGDTKVAVHCILPAVFCPKPCRLSRPAAVHHSDSSLPRWLASHRKEYPNSNAAWDLLDSFLIKDGEEEDNQTATSPPFFFGSPPDRTANPVVHDARFVGEDRPWAAQPLPQFPLTKSSLPPESPKQGCARAKLGLVPEAVRIEGFDYLSSGRPGCSGITAMA